MHAKLREGPEALGARRRLQLGQAPRYLRVFGSSQGPSRPIDAYPKNRSHYSELSAGLAAEFAANLQKKNSYGTYRYGCERTLLLIFEP